jgi:hypothetical protein
MIKIAVVSYNNETPISSVAASFSETPQTIDAATTIFWSYQIPNILFPALRPKSGAMEHIII